MRSNDDNPRIDRGSWGSGLLVRWQRSSRPGRNQDKHPDRPIVSVFRQQQRARRRHPRRTAGLLQADQRGGRSQRAHPRAHRAGRRQRRQTLRRERKDPDRTERRARADRLCQRHPEPPRSPVRRKEQDRIRRSVHRRGADARVSPQRVQHSRKLRRRAREDRRFLYDNWNEEVFRHPLRRRHRQGKSHRRNSL